MYTTLQMKMTHQIIYYWNNLDDVFDETERDYQVQCRGKGG